MPDYDDPAVEEQWCEERRAQVSAYLQGEGVVHGSIGVRPAWHVAPYVSVWAVESKIRPEWVGWWAICGDLPTDYVSAAELKHPREAVRSIASEWLEQARLMRSQDQPDAIRIGRPEDWASLAPLLEARATLLHDFANDDSVWQQVDAR